MSKGRAGAAAIRQVEGLFRGGTVAGLTDRQLLQRFAARGDESAFAALVERHGPMVLGVCRRVVRDRHGAEDAFQAAFLVLVRKAGSIRVDDSLGRWLYTVARRIALRAGAAATGRAEVGLAEAGEVVDDGVDPAERREAWSALHEELGRLPEPYRAAVVLCHLEGLTHEEAARRLGWPLGTVKGRLARARGLLRARLARRGIGLTAVALAATLRPSAVSAALVDRTVSAAIGFAAGRAATAGTVPAALLANGVLGAMLMGKIKIAGLIVAAFGAGLAGVGLVRLPEGPGRVARADDRPPGAKSAKDDPPPDPGPELSDRVRRLKLALADVQRQERSTAYQRARREVVEEAVQADLEHRRRLGEIEVKKRQLELLHSGLDNVEQPRARDKAVLRDVQTRLGRPEDNQEPFRENRAFADVLSNVDKAPTARLAEPPAIEGQKRSLPEYVVEPPDLIRVSVPKALPGREILGERLVRPDGRISLGFYGEVYVAGLTVAQVKEKVTVHLRKHLSDADLGLVKGDGSRLEPRDTPAVSVDVAAYNSKVYYVQGEVGSPGRLPITGNETVLDAITLVGGLLPTASKPNIRLIRPAPPGACCEQVLPVDLDAIVHKADATTNYQILPGDRLVVYRDPEPAGPPAPADEARRKQIEGRIDAIIRELEGLRGELKK